AANWMWIEHTTGEPVRDQIDYEAKRDQIARERDGKAETSDTDFFTARRKEYEVIKQSEAATTELIGKGVMKAVADQLANKPTEMTPVMDEVTAKDPDA